MFVADVDPVVHDGAGLAGPLRAKGPCQMRRAVRIDLRCEPTDATVPWADAGSRAL
jgi:hypothetical protein